MKRVWTQFLSRLGILLLAGLFVGWYFGKPLGGLAGAALIALGYQLFFLTYLRDWLETGKVARIPPGEGLWAQILARIDFERTKGRKRGKRVRRLLKEVRSSAQAFPDPGVLIDEQNQIVAINKAAERLLGFRRKADRGQRIENLIRTPAFVEYLNGGGIRKKPLTMQAPADPDVWLSIRIIPYAVNQRLLLARDISVQVRTEATRRDFVANASHELRTPLTVIMGYLDVIADDPALADDLEVPIAEMGRQVERMQSLVEDLLRLSELESGDERPEGRPVNMASLLAAARQEVAVIEDAPANVEIKVTSEARLIAEEAEIQSVLTNLISNAARYTESDGHLILSWFVDEDGGHLSVRDDGCGIASENIPRLTERFYRVDDGRDRSRGGTGLGLAIVKHVMNRHGGHLEILSEPGKGSDFICHFPRKRIALEQAIENTG